jgi:two-component system NtrC family response regulator/two-component system response regulator AtoC
MLVIDNSLSVRESLRIIFQDVFHVKTTDPWQDILSLLVADQFDLIIIGLGGRGGQEIDLLRDITTFNPQLPLMALVDQEHRENLEGISSSYVTDLVIKPFNVFELREKVKKLQTKGSVSPYVRSPLKMRHIFQQQKIYFAPSVRHKLSEVTLRTKYAAVFPVLLRGERGTGRETAAKWLHFRSPNIDRLFFKLNGAALMEDTFVNSFLLKEKGSFRSKNLGTLYIEEAGNLRPEIQERLIEILDEGSIVTPEGREVLINFRVVVSSSQDLRELVYKKVFKEELFYKLNVIDIYLSPLRERQEDIPGIAQQILETAAKKFTLRAKGFSPEALETLKNYYWPGNVRELESVIIRSLIFSSQEMLSEHDLRFGMEESTELQEPEDEESPEKKSFIEVVKPERPPAVKKESHFPEKGEAVFTELVTELAHEIKNPLVAIKTFTQLLAERFDDKDFREQFYQTAGENIDRIDRLVERIISSARFSLPALAQVNLHQLVDKSLANNTDAFNKKHIVCKKDFMEHLPLILTDEEQLHYVVNNILSAIYSLIPQGTEIFLSTKTTRLDPREKGRFPLEQLPNGSAAELSISYPDIIDEKEVSTYHSIELFLAQQIIQRNLGLMEITPSAEKTTIIIKLPVATGGKS